MRSMAQFHRPVSAMPMASTTISAKITAATLVPMIGSRIIRTMRAMKVDSMNTSPCAKFTMPMMPNTIV